MVVSVLVCDSKCIGCFETLPQSLSQSQHNPQEPISRGCVSRVRVGLRRSKGRLVS